VDDDQGDGEGQGGEHHHELEGGRDAVGQDLVGAGAGSWPVCWNWAWAGAAGGR
jgi:hypothetical protein